MTSEFTSIANFFFNRRTVKAFMMNGHKAPNAHIAALLELADWAPTHGYTEPWRFNVYETPAEFCLAHANLYKAATPESEFNESTYNTLRTQGDKSSHIIIATMKRGSLPKIPAFEEQAAAACAIQNLLLGATALNMASYWSTGGMALKPAMKEFLALGDDDQVMGILYLGYSDERPTGKRTVPLEEKVKWH